ncbi:MAG: O-linked N-acetylglucosamine transferase, SPINDLY family protein [Acidiferrobacterales bacterium]
MNTQNILTQGKKRQALALLQGNRVAEARSFFEQIIQADRNDIESWIYLVKINAQLGQPDRVEKCCREIIRIQPQSHEAHYHLGCALMFQSKQHDAIETFQRAIQIKPDHAPTHMHLGNLSASLTEARQHYERAARLEPGFAEAHASVGAVLVSCGQVDEAITSFRHALRLKPNLHRVHSDMLFALNYSPAYDADAIFAEHAHWGRAHALSVVSSLANTPDPDRRLRIGYVSPDLREHSVAYFFEPLFANHSESEVETFCYAEVARPDATTRRLQSIAKHWHITCGMSDAALAERIRADHIDILIDLAGHSANSRLLTFSARPAPVQITYLGYPNATGLNTMDYRLTDDWADPPNQTERYHSEKLIRLPRGFLCYLPPSDAPAVTPPPAISNGFVTFGSFNNLPKVTPEVTYLWATLLRTVPNARLVLKNYSLADPACRERYFRLFAEYGVASDRLDFRGRHDTMTEHLGSYSGIDIALDTFPYNGTTTTCEALLMGVPVVTPAGHHHASRVGASLLNQTGLSQLVAESPETYVRIAADLAANREELAHLRASLREQMVRSALCNGRDFVRDLERTYRTLWKKWCIDHAGAPSNRHGSNCFP